MNSSKCISLDNPNRFYSWNIVTYTDLNLVIDILKDFATHYVYILHDKDNVDNHFHLLITFKRAYSIKKVLSFFPTYANTFLYPNEKRDFAGDFLYLTHSNCSDKFHYDNNALVSNDLDFYLSFLNLKSNETKNVDLLNDICLVVKIDLNFLVTKYGRDFMLNCSRYLSFRDFYRYFYGLDNISNEDKKNNAVMYEQEKLVNEKNRF